MTVPSMTENGRSILLYLADNDGTSVSDISEGMEKTKRDVAKGLALLEIYGMTRLNWERRADKRWVAIYYLAGEGTMDYIKSLKLRLSEGRPSSSLKETST